MPNPLPSSPPAQPAPIGSALLACALFLASPSAYAQASAEAASSGAPSAPRTLHAASLQLTGSNFDAGAALGYRVRFAGGMQLGLEGRALAVRDAYVNGFAATGGYAVSGVGLVMVPMVQSGPLDLHFRASLGARSLNVDETTGPDKRGLTLLSELGPVVNIRATKSLTLRTGWLAVTNFQLSPAFDSEALGQVLLAGAVVPVTDDVQLHADVETGGLFGFDGDGGKYVVRGFVGARWAFGGSARSWLSF